MKTKREMIAYMRAFTTRACQAAFAWAKAEELEGEAQRAGNDESAKELRALARSARAEWMSKQT